MGIGMTKVLHVKIPVTDLQRSAAWYAALMDLELSREFIEDGALRGAALHSAEAGFAFALRLREHCASKPSLEGFDVVALHMESREALEKLHARCVSLDVGCTDIQDRAEHEAVVDVSDPDGTVLRFYWVGEPEEADRFLGIMFEGGRPPTLTSTPRLDHLPLVGRTS